MDKLIKILENNSRLSNQDIAVMLGETEQAVAEKICRYEQEGVIRGYKTVINWDKVDNEHVTALIEIKVTPKRGHGFEEIAQRITQLDEVESLYLMSGAYDFAVMITGKTFQEVAMFVSKRLSPMDSVLSTATHFVLRRYKDMGIELSPASGDDRGIVSL